MRERTVGRAWGLVVWVLVGMVGQLSAAAEGLTIVENGQAKAVVVVPADCEPTLQDAASRLVECVATSSGAKLPVVADDVWDVNKYPSGTVSIHVGPTSYSRPLIGDVGELDADGFLIRTLQKTHILVAGPTDTGTAFGVGDFLERYVGVRWLLPGEEGTHIPSRRTIEVPEVDVRDEPAFFSRSFSGFNFGDSADLAWLHAARMHPRIGFHHHLLRLFPAETYATSHPEFFPWIDGERRLPKPNRSWQPCFTASGIVEEAVRNIGQYFEQNPAATSYSLGINDTGTDGWCQCEECSAQHSGKVNSLGVADYSDVYYAWCNRVIEGVLTTYPDKWFGCLAYNNVFAPPSQVAIHPRLIPYVTLDRMQWADSRLRKEGQRLHRRWQRACPSLGWYDYLYGRFYSLPRVYPHRMAENLRYAHRHGVQAFYAEAYPNWGEGPKLYVMARLLWNPDADVDGLLRDWYVRSAGENAAADLARYYEHWEDFWTRRVLDSPWFGRGEILNFRTQGYLGSVTLREMAQCREWLESALAKTETAPQRARVGRLLTAFEGYEDAALHYLTNMGEGAPEDVLSGFLAGDPPAPQKQKAEELRAMLLGQTPVISQNPSFEDGSEDQPDRWTLWVKPVGDPPYGTIQWIESPDALTGQRCLVVEGLRRGGPVQQIPARPGRYVLVASYRWPSDRQGQGVEMSVILKDEKGRNLSFDRHSDVTVVQLIPGPWRTITRPFVVPAKIGSATVTGIQLGVVIERMAPEEKIYYDDVGVYRLGD
ncbi:MAG TPA: DUF4838 domain-containing protein [Armatimonadota bacterium]|nr:DUF4838 domain-containing protein [Armatimonadota bacterium]